MKQKMTLICLREGCNEIIAVNINYVPTDADTLNEELVSQVSKNISK